MLRDRASDEILGERNLVPVLTYLFRRIEKRLDGSPGLILLDEAWLMLGHPVFRAKICEWLKVLRKANCAVVLATQSISDAERSGIIDVLKEFLPDKNLLAEWRCSRAGRSGVLRADRLQRTPDRDRVERHPETRLLRRDARWPTVIRHVARARRAQLRRRLRKRGPEAHSHTEGSAWWKLADQMA